MVAVSCVESLYQLASDPCFILCVLGICAALFVWIRLVCRDMVATRYVFWWCPLFQLLWYEQFRFQILSHYHQVRRFITISWTHFIVSTGFTRLIVRKLTSASNLAGHERFKSCVPHHSSIKYISVILMPAHSIRLIAKYATFRRRWGAGWYRHRARFLSLIWLLWLVSVFCIVRRAVVQPVVRTSALAITACCLILLWVPWPLRLLLWLSRPIAVVCVGPVFLFLFP